MCSSSLSIGMITSTNHVVGIKLQSRLNSYTAAIECIVIDRITDKILTFSLGRDKFNLPRNIRLARDLTFAISHIVGSFNRCGLVLESNMRWSNQVFEQLTQLSKKHDWAGFWSFGQHHIDRRKGPLIPRIRNQCGITRTCQSCLANGRHFHATTQLHNGGKHLRASLFRQRVSKFSR